MAAARFDEPQAPREVDRDRRLGEGSDRPDDLHRGTIRLVEVQEAVALFLSRFQLSLGNGASIPIFSNSRPNRLVRSSLATQQTLS